MKLLRAGVVVLAVLVSFVLPAHAVTPGQAKLTAKRAATVDAYRNLLEQVNGVQISGNTYVRDFIAESDEIKAAMEGYLKGAKTTDARFFEDGTCEVDVELTIEELVADIKHVVKEVYKGGKWREETFDQLLAHTQLKVIKATGRGAPREITPEGTPAATRQTVRQSPIAGIAGWEGVTGQQRLMAERAAKVDALRNLAERIMGLKLTASTYVRDFVAESDEIKTQVNAFIKGARYDSYRYLPDAIVEVDATVTMQDLVMNLKHIVKEYYKGGKKFDERSFDTMEITAKEHDITVTGSGTVGGQRATVNASSVAPAAGIGIPDWSTETIKATGNGVPNKDMDANQARLMAERAAEIDAKRNLLEQIGGLFISSETTVENFMTQSDEVKAGVNGYLRGARKIATREMKDGVIQVDVEIPLDGIWLIVKKHYR